MVITGLITGVVYRFQVMAQALVEGMIVLGERSLLTDILLPTASPGE